MTHPAPDRTPWPEAGRAHSRLIVVRHGQTAHNAGRRLQGHSDTPLDEVGLTQARQLAAHLQARGVRAPRLHSSDLRRAAQTAGALQAVLGGAVTLHGALREIRMGDWEGQRLDDIQAADPDRHARFWGGDPACAAPGGETPVEVTDRVHGLLAGLAPAPGETLVLVSHGIAITGLLCRLLGLDYARAFAAGTTLHGNTAYSVLTLDGLRVVGSSLARTDHLSHVPVGTGA